MENLTIVILAAGLGTRMKSKKAKVLHEAGGKPLVGHVVDTALALAPAGRIFVVVGNQAEQVEAAMASRGVRFIRQHQQLGTGDALRVCHDQVAPLGGDVVVLYGDCPLLSVATVERLIALQRERTGAATVITTELDNPTGYGRILRAADGSVAAIVEQKAATPEQLGVREINSGIYSFNGELLWRYLAHVETNQKGGEVYLTDIVELFQKDGHSVFPMLLDDPSEVLGVNTRVDLAGVDALFRARKVRELMLAGVTIEKPETVTVDLDVTVGMDTIIEPFVRLLGRTSIGEECRICACSIIRDSELGNQVLVREYTSLDQCHIDRGAKLGPFSRLRQHAHMKAGSEVGNFVELKNTELGAGTKSRHLAYLGDSVIGGAANIGAGTITCNYDGKKKSKTKIGDRAFVGSNSTLVAPLEIGDDAYIGAGSVVTKSVPPETLALGRAHQINKEGWVRKRRDS